MRVWDIAKLAGRNVSRGKSRVSLAVIALTVGITAVLLLGAVGNTAKLAIVEKLSGFGMDGIIVFAGDYTGLTASDGEDIVQCISGVEAAMPLEFWFTYYQIGVGRNQPTMIIGADENLGQYMDIEVLSGRGINAWDCSLDSRVCLVDSELARAHFGHLNIAGEKIVLIADGSEYEFSIIGVFDSALNSAVGMLGMDVPPFIYVPWTSLGNSANGDISQMALKLSSEADSERIAAGVQSYLADTKTNGRAFDVENMAGYKSDFATVMDTVSALLTATAAISLVVAALGVMSSMLSGVNERRGEIGVCKAIGARSRDICLIFLGEAALISLLGCLLGVGVGLCTAYTAFYVLLDSLPKIDFLSVLVPCAVTVCVGLISGVIPAIQAARLAPVSAIRKD